MGTNCQICGQEDLFSYVTGDGVCSACQLTYLGGKTATPELIAGIQKAIQSAATPQEENPE